MASAADYKEVTEQLYLAYLGRPADRSGYLAVSSQLAAANAPTTVAGLVGVYGSNAAVKTVLDNFANSAESSSLYDSVITAKFVSGIYLNLMARTPELAELDFWVGALGSNAVSRATAPLQILVEAGKASTADWLTISHKTEAVAYFNDHLDIDLRAQWYSGDLMAMSLRSALGQVDGTTSVAKAHELMDGVWMPGHVPALDYTSLVQQIYLAFLWRPADHSGMVNATQYLASINAPSSLADLQAAYGSNGGIKQLVDNFSTSAESQALYNGIDDATYVSNAYLHLLNRAPDLAGLTFWADALRDKVVTREVVATQIIAAATKPGANAEDYATIANKLAFSAYFTATSDDTPARLIKYAGSSADVVRGMELAVGNATTSQAIHALVDDYWLTDVVSNLPATGLVGISAAASLI